MSRACAELSPLATKMLMMLMSQLGSRHYGNGRLDAHERRMRRDGWPGRASAVAALKELMDASLVVCTRQGRKGRIGLYAVTLFPMHCGGHGDLDVGPGAWTTTEWQDKTDRGTPPTDGRPATWTRPRSGEKRKASARRETESAECSPAAGQKDPGEPPCSPAAGQHEGVSRRDAVPLRDSLLRLPSAGAVARRPARPLWRRIAAVLAARVEHRKNPAHVAHLSAIGLDCLALPGNSAAAAPFPPAASATPLPDRRCAEGPHARLLAAAPRRATKEPA